RGPDDPSDPRVPRAHGTRGGVQAGRRDAQGQAGARMAHPDEGRAGGPVAPRRPVPARRFGAAHRYRTPARAFLHGSLFGGAPSPHGMTMRFSRAAATVALLLGAASASAAQGAASDTSSVSAARRLLDAAERELAIRAVKVNRAGWVGESFITHDTEI